MIDPKFNEIPADETEPLTEEERQARMQATPRRGLSINDTIARDASLSIGGQGADTSGVSAGAGAGAGTTHLSSANEGSPAPKIEPGARGTGTTAAGSTRADKTAPDHKDYDK